ncbi:MAG: hypothetical protein PVI88_00450 [Nitrosopumilaceae archaeon]|jgi:hypothetical protein
MNDAQRQTEIINLQRKLEQLKAQQEQYKGMKKQLQNEMEQAGYNSLSEVKEKRKELQEQVKKDQAVLDKKIERFKEKHNLD